MYVHAHIYTPGILSRCIMGVELGDKRKGLQDNPALGWTVTAHRVPPTWVPGAW